MIIEKGMILEKVMNFFRLALPMAVLLAAGCATQANPGHEPAGWENMPRAGISPWLKIDVDDNAYNGAQPFISTTPLSEAITAMDGVEPAVIRHEGVFKMWFEMDGVVFFSTSADGTLWAAAEPVEIRSDGWEGGRFGAPSVLESGGALEMWYVGGDGAGIGRAVPGDGTLVWDAVRTDLAPRQAWEGGPSGRVDGPSVIWDEWEGEAAYRMWYTGWDLLGRGRIGHAVSRDGVAWTRIDGEGREGSGPLSQIDPVMGADQEWETGSVWSPCVIRDDTSQRRLYKMYYTGGRLVDAELFFNMHDASIGVAASTDGLRWEKIRSGINPVVGEKFILDLGGLWLPFCPDGGEGPCPMRSFLTLVSSLIRYDESGPAVVLDGEEYLMWFAQVDTLNYLMPPNLRGLSMATSPPRLDF